MPFVKVTWRLCMCKVTHHSSLNCNILQHTTLLIHSHMWRHPSFYRNTLQQTAPLIRMCNDTHRHVCIVDFIVMDLGDWKQDFEIVSVIKIASRNGNARVPCWSIGNLLLSLSLCQWVWRRYKDPRRTPNKRGRVHEYIRSTHTHTYARTRVRVCVRLRMRVCVCTH